ncbi:MAG TPA: thymidine kinase [Microbacterium sp.]|uniref:thymidine kinase n=1 Tax=Microbacterium sp. TaxID=51671 RepID=UPI002CBC004B|nr:thymidine kinase [Microbacterium sp.]HWI31082.1 thymidine kinase [Microbacterium sp.]
MAKLYFRYGAMNSGKSTALLQAAYNYEERGQRVLLAKPAIDTKAADQVESRLGMSRTVDFVLAPGDEPRDVFARSAARVAAETGGRVACLLVDEAQFLTAGQVDGLFRIAVLDDIPVLAYGIRTDFRTEAFPGSRRLLEVAHTLEELKTICRCGRKALFNGRLIDGRFVFAGDQVAIDTSTGLSASTSTGLSASGEVTYESLCGLCYLEESGGHLDGR